MKTNDRKITDLMATIHTGKTQLPDFQRGWVWDDNRIKFLIASITNGYPVGAAMFLEYGNTISDSNIGSSRVHHQQMLYQMS